jgi:hypothetical protein
MQEFAEAAPFDIEGEIDVRVGADVVVDGNPDGSA